MQRLTRSNGFGARRSHLAPATFVTESHATRPGTNGTVTLSLTGAAAGDLCIVYIQTTFQSASAPSGFTSVGSGIWPSQDYEWSISQKILTSGDITAGTISVTNVDEIAGLLIYRGASSATLIENNDSTSASVSTLVLAGFAKNAACVGVITMADDGDPSSTGMTPPSGFTMRASPFSGFRLIHAVADAPPANYTDAATLTWTNFVTGNFQHGWLLELRS